jgi:hypothetical protein
MKLLAPAFTLVFALDLAGVYLAGLQEMGNGGSVTGDMRWVLEWHDCNCYVTSPLRPYSSDDTC